MPSKKRKRDTDRTNNSNDTSVENKKTRIQSEIDIHTEIIQILSDCKDTHENTIDIKMIEGAVRGSMKNQFKLARCYSFGRGIAKNKINTFKWYLKAAEQGFALAQLHVGYCYSYGLGINKNEKEAFKWMLKSAKQGVKGAQLNVSYHYLNAIGVDKNEKEAFKWMNDSAKQGFLQAQYSLGTCYETGMLVSKNDETALKWYKKAADHGHKEAQKKILELQRSTTKESRIKSELDTISTKQEVSAQDQPSPFQLSL